MKSGLKHKLEFVDKNMYASLAIVFALCFGAMGAAIEYASRAASPTPEILSHVAGTSSWCMTDEQNSTAKNNQIQTAYCNGGRGQQFTFNSSKKRIQITSLGGTYCVDIKDGKKTAGSYIVLNNCNGVATQVWSRVGNLFVQGSTTTAANKECIAVYGGQTGTWLRLNDCNKSYGSQNWILTTYGTASPPPSPPPPAPSPNPSPSPKPSPSPSPSPKPSPKPSPSPKPGSSGPGHAGSSSKKSPSSVGSVTLNSPSNSSGGGSGITLSPSSPSSTTLDLNNSSGNSSNNSGSQAPQTNTPTVSDIRIVNLSTNSVTLAWLGSDSDSYLIKYGATSPQQLNQTKTINTTKSTVTLLLSNLPTGKTVYVRIIPSKNGSAGTSQLVNFKTNAKGSPVGLIIFLFFVLLLLIVAARIIAKRFANRASEPSYELDASNAEPFPQEDTAQTNSRLLWWMPEEEKKEVISHAQTQDDQKAQNDEPDMFAEGRKRLEEEEKENRLPKY